MKQDIAWKRFALTIAGSDSSGGAGIQADLRAFTVFGVVGASAVTAVTAQGPEGVTAIQSVEPDVLKQQIEAAFASYDLSAIKIGMLGDEAQVRVVVDALEKYRPPNIVLDPVLTSTSGASLLTAAGRQVMIERLLPLADVITPNAQELATLTGLPTNTEEQRFSAARALPRKAGATVIVTGGDAHAKDLIVREAPGPKSVQTLFINTEHTHGTGCAFSAAIAAKLAEGRSIASIDVVKELINWGLAYPIVPKQGRGHPNTYGSWAGLEHRESNMPLSVLRGVYVITDSKLNPNLSALQQAREAYRGGASTVQLREKHLPTPKLIELARRLQDYAEGVNVFIVNDRVDVVIAAETDGVHLGPDDMPVAMARKILGWEKIIGCSIGSIEEADAVAQFASYLAVGAVFGSSSKSDAGPPVGLELVSKIKARHPLITLVAIGGINLSNIASVAAAGADAAAVISAVVCAPDLKQATKELVAEFERGKAQRNL